MLREKIFVSCIVTSYIATIFFISKYNWLVVSIAPLLSFSLSFQSASFRSYIFFIFSMRIKMIEQDVWSKYFFVYSKIYSRVHFT